MNYFIDVVKNKYAQFTGRARRSEYWYFILFYFILSVALTLLDMVLGLGNAAGGLGVFNGILTLALIVPSIAVAIRRMHDVGKSGWYCLIPIYNLILACTAGEVGSNEYGPDPKSDDLDVTDHLID